MNQSKILLLFGNLLLVCLIMLCAMNINDVHGHDIDIHKFLRLSREYDETQKIKDTITIRGKLAYQTGINESDLFKNKASTQKIPLLVSFYIFSKHIKPFTPKKILCSPFNNGNNILINNNQKHITSSIKNPLPFPTFQLIDTSIIRS